MGFFKWLIIIIVVILGVYFFFPDTYAKGDDFVKKLWGSDEIQNLFDEENISSNTTSNESLETERQTYSKENVHCGWNNQYEAYVFDKGRTSCAEAESPDVFCLQNPPLEYTGSINLVEEFSSPEMKCCIPTGDCSWK